MGRIGKALALLLTLTIVMSALTLPTVKSVNAQTIPKPSVPELDVVFVNRSYNVEPTTTTTTNPYTGDKMVTTNEGYYIQNDSFVLSVRSQPLTTNDKFDGHSLSLFFIVQSKGHYSSYWDNLTFVGIGEYLPTDNGYAQKTMELSGNNGTTYSEEGGYNNYGYDGFVGGQYGGEVDFRAMAVFGYVITIQDEPNPFSIRHPYHSEVVVVQSSDWTNTQTVSILDELVPYSTPNPSPTVPEFPFIAVLPLLAVIPLITILAKKRICLKF